ncbi:MAG: alpha/beta hydrolase [Armatimonadetes bacterium]|nr:alpha/beta hydrolase [Armatimonadota bacterium]
MSVLLDLAYAGDHPRQRLDLYLPDGPHTGPLVVFCHGGAWLSGDRSDVAHVGRFLAGNGCVVVCPSYRLAPEHRFPAQAHDVVSALVWLAAAAAPLGLDRAPLVLAGHSAGAQLATLLALDPRWLPASIEPAGVVGLCGVYDLVAAAGSRWMRSTMLQPALGDDPDLWREASPVTHARSHPARFWLHNAQVDWGLHRHTAALAAALAAHGTAVQTTVAEGRHHLDLVAHLGDEGDATSGLLLGFLRSLAGGSP